MDDYDTEEFYEYPDDLGRNQQPETPPTNDNYDRNRYKTAYGPYCGGYGPMGSGRGGYGPNDNFGPLGYGPPPGPWPAGPGMWTRGPPYPSRSQKNDAVKYLIKCGVPREHMKNLPRDLLEMINPDYCGLCAVEFDTFVLSRLHYNSRNHLKNQRKWQMNRGHGGAYAMGPLKSRDLYCELCDVEITSKAHSESHYLGKAHRGIVEGRRNPKNPILLQPGMEDRVKQLVRREKRFLVTEEIDQREPSTESVDIKDRIPAELHCDICKTFVTCTEQMTLHLNGKKHLNKEKQHILRMMKGETSSHGEPSKSTSNDDDLLETLDYVLDKLPPIEDKDLRKEIDATNDDEAAENWEKNGEAWDEPETLLA